VVGGVNMDMITLGSKDMYSLFSLPNSLDVYMIIWKFDTLVRGELICKYTANASPFIILGSDDEIEPITFETFYIRIDHNNKTIKWWNDPRQYIEKAKWRKISSLIGIILMMIAASIPIGRVWLAAGRSIFSYMLFVFPAMLALSLFLFGLIYWVNGFKRLLLLFLTVLCILGGGFLLYFKLF
jgi:hypothetical protein